MQYQSISYIYTVITCKKGNLTNHAMLIDEVLEAVFTCQYRPTSMFWVKSCEIMFSQPGWVGGFPICFPMFWWFSYVFLYVFPVKSVGSGVAQILSPGKNEEMTSILEKEGRWHQALRPRQAGPRS
jgi:hypothetical protein